MPQWRGPKVKKNKVKRGLCDNLSDPVKTLVHIAANAGVAACCGSAAAQLMFERLMKELPDKIGASYLVSVNRTFTHFVSWCKKKNLSATDTDTESIRDFMWLASNQKSGKVGRSTPKARHDHLSVVNRQLKIIPAVLDIVKPAAG